ncbi:MAG: DUF2807 domain-containing protein [Proteobacteria bacterium]|jgi:hypothetical protein|nr:DUF2807 domain-containing protein [Pseudomonadota bacterium]
MLTSPDYAMNRALLPIMILFCVAIAAGLAWLTLNRRDAPPAAAPTTRSADLPPFHRIAIDGIASVALVQGDREHVEVEVPAGARGVTARVRNGTLDVSASERSRSWTWMFGTRERNRAVRVVVTYRSIDRLALSGAVKVAAGPMRADALTIDASGGSSLRIEALTAKRLEVSGSGALDARIAGTVDDENVSISGAGAYHAENLRAQRARVDVSGVGSVVVRVEQTLDASISGAGNIDYYGDPAVKESVSGIGRVRRREPDATAGASAPVSALAVRAWSAEEALRNGNGPCVSGQPRREAAAMLRRASSTAKAEGAGYRDGLRHRLRSATELARHGTPLPRPSRSV